jgi:hypothetical protein
MSITGILLENEASADPLSGRRGMAAAKKKENHETSLFSCGETEPSWPYVLRLCRLESKAIRM